MSRRINNDTADPTPIAIPARTPATHGRDGERARPATRPGPQLVASHSSAATAASPTASDRRRPGPSSSPLPAPNTATPTPNSQYTHSEALPEVPRPA